MSIFGDLIKGLIPVVLSGLETLADSYVKGEELNKDQKQLLYSGYVIINTWVDDFVESTENDYDDMTLKILSNWAADTLSEAGIEVPEIPDELLEKPGEEPEE